jgi:hypothetical protein
MKKCVKVACIHCKKSNKKCDDARPCGRCKRLNKDNCIDAPRKRKIVYDVQQDYNAELFYNIDIQQFIEWFVQENQ